MLETKDHIPNAAERVATLRERLLARKDPEEIQFQRVNAVVAARSLRASEGEPSWQVRRGRLTRDRLAAARFDFDRLEPLAGRIRLGHRNATEDEYREALRYLQGGPFPPGQTGHCELHVAPVFAGGIDGLRGDVRSRLENASGQSADTYRSFLDALDGLSGMIANAAEDVAAVAGDAHEVAASCRQIDHGPPGSFRDAIQVLWFIDLAVMHGEDVGLVVPGHIDRALYPFYHADLERGALTRDEALLLIEGLYLLINEYIPDGLAMSVMVGGRDADGRDVANDLSYLCLEALRRTNFIYPTVGVCWHEGTPAGLVELAVELIGHGYPTPAFFGDETIQRGLKALGVPTAQACHYINSTCVEITPATASNVWVASPYFPTCRILLDEIAAQVESGAPAETFEGFRQGYYARLAHWIARAVEAENDSRRQRLDCGRKPLQSVFTRDCVERGRDIDDGGALYNWVECSFVGLANLADSFHVIREEVFNRERLSLAELKAVLDANFEGHESTRRRFLEGYPKYGQDRPEVDGLFGETIEFLRAECAKHRMQPDGSPFVPGAFCWIMHEILGRDCGATPDGRKAGVPFADGCGPAQGREANGPTAAILSTTSWEHSPMIGGLAYNMKFNTRFFDSPKGFEALRDLILTFLRRGGFETQINVVDAETLKEAREHPEDHRDLMVRIGGYADYFTRLSPEMQDEIIMRTEFAGV